jgi:hypothetical protein
MLVESITISRRDFDAAIDLDGVLTETARVHTAAWKAVFDAFLQRWMQQRGLTFQPFDIKVRPRDDGIRSFLSARGINLPEGSEHGPALPKRVWRQLDAGLMSDACHVVEAIRGFVRTARNAICIAVS